MTKALDYLLDRLKEPATWRGIIALLTASGVALSPEQAEAIIPFGMAVAGFIGIVTKG